MCGSVWAGGRGEAAKRAEMRAGGGAEKRADGERWTAGPVRGGCRGLFPSPESPARRPALSGPSQPRGSVATRSSPSAHPGASWHTQLPTPAPSPPPCSSICATPRMHMVTRVQNMFSTHATRSPPAQSRCCCSSQINHRARILPAVPGRVARRPTSQQLPIIYEWKRVCTSLCPQPLST